MNNCTICMGRYEFYKVGKDEDVGACMSIIPAGKWGRILFWKNIKHALFCLTYRGKGKPVWNIQRKFIPNKPVGVCQFHNPKSKLFTGK